MTAPPRHPFDCLTPQVILDLLDSLGVRGDGRMLQLNSYENRVFQVMLETGGAIVAKFYRPGRWTDAQIQEEHGFAAELAAAEVPVVAPQILAHGTSLGTGTVSDERFRIAVYPLRAGHGPELDQPDTLRWLGRFIGRLHAVGAQGAFLHRRSLNAHTFGHAALQKLLALDIIPAAQAPAWHDASLQALDAVTQAFTAASADAALQTLRLHGDCHPGNILWRDEGDRGGPQIVDLDDAVTGPAIQDLWMLLSGDREAMRSQMVAVLDGYRQFRPFNARELALIEPLRTLRMVHHSAWLAERWSDPAFPVGFPWFGNASYWGQQTIQLREQIEAMREPPMDLGPSITADDDHTPWH